MTFYYLAFITSFHYFSIFSTIYSISNFCTQEYIICFDTNLIATFYSFHRQKCRERVMVAEKLLILNLKRGREEAYRQLIEEYGNRLLRTCYLILKDREEAEDVVQETFIKVFKKIDTFKEKSGLYTWIYAIALNLSRDRMRMKQDMLELKDEW
ncbi:MAG TPA: hypothetical protein DC024_11525, partial [Clostridiales bacterium]|nr:hypothetical protein [Clostridiales bacterium]